MDVKTFTPREDLNQELDNMNEEQILQLLAYARRLVSDGSCSALSGSPEKQLSSNSNAEYLSHLPVSHYQFCPLWNSPEEDEAWAHL